MMTQKERKEALERIYSMIGNPEQQREMVVNFSLQERIRSNANYRETKERLLKIAEKEGVKALCSVVIMTGKHCTGLTANNKKYIWEGNSGYTERSRYCGSLYIEGMGTVFTSGRIEKAVEYLIKN